MMNSLSLAVRANGEEAMLEHLVDWVCAACTLTFDANNAHAPPVTLLTNGLLVHPGMDEKLAVHVRDKDRLLAAAQHQAQQVEDRAPRLLSQTDPELVLILTRSFRSGQ
jgi:hypothetical protein